MIYVRLQKNNSYYLATLIHYQPFNERFGLKKTEAELLQDGILVTNLPVKEEPEEGYYMELRATLKDKNLYYEKVQNLVSE